jgi:hypothetical protein
MVPLVHRASSGSFLMLADLPAILEALRIRDSSCL